ncbi:MAG: extracellular solute-binding protein, partial [Nocardioides sp.]
MRTRALGRGVGLLLCGLLVVACSPTPPDSGPTPSPGNGGSASAEPVSLRLGVVAAPAEDAAWKTMVERFAPPDGQQINVDLEVWRDRAAAEAAIATDPPDVFMISRQQLPELMIAGTIQPVSDLLDEREVDFGDGYERSSILAFSEDNALQCMPWSSSPQVIYYNTALIDFDRMSRRGKDVPEDGDSWNLDEFVAAAEAATRPGKGSRGFYVAPTLAGLSSWIYAAGGDVFDDERAPTSLAFATDDTLSALDTLLPLLRRQQLTLTTEQLEKATPLEWFTRGRLGMLVGDRSLVPGLRALPKLKWDVMPLPSIDEAATIGDYGALCMSAAAPAEPAADLIAHLISTDSVALITTKGYLVPSNSEVLEGASFTQAGRLPTNPRAFVRSVRQIELPPALFITP